MEANSQSKTVLIVEDEKNIVDILRFNLQREGYRTVEAYDGADGLAKARSENPDIILLDVMLPKMIGFDVCRTLREEGNNVPVIILTAREEEADKVLGLEIGADDYITKPFSMRELIARVKANIRRTGMNAAAAATAATTAMPVVGNLSINTDSRQVFRDGKPMDLTTREYELLTFLASHPNKVYSRIDLMEQVWNYGYVGEDQRTVDVTVRRLREKIEADPASPKYILTRRGAGYYFAVPLRLLLLAAALGYTLSGILLRGDAKHGSIRRDIRPLTICFSGRERRVRVLEDTGHSLTEPVSGKPVLILCRGEASLLLNDPLDGDAAQQLTALPAETAAHCGLVPYRAVGTESGLLLYFRPDRVLEADGTTLDCVCAAGPPGFESGQYEGLICV